MSASEVQQTSASTTGTWGTVSNTAYSGGSAIQSSTAGASVTFTVTGRAIWLLTQTHEAGGQFAVTVDGVSYQTGSCFGVGTATRYRVLYPLARGLTDGAHTVVITAVTTAAVTIDSLIVVTGVLIAPTAGNLVVLGDSVSAGYGLANILSAWGSRVAELLGHKLNRPFTFINKAVSEDSLFAIDSAPHTGGMYRVFSDVVGQTPEVLTVMFGINDLLLNATLPGEYAAYLLSILQFIEDLFATSSIAVILCVPTYVGPLTLTSAPSGNQSGYYAGTPCENWHLALEFVKVMGNMFSWCNIAYTHEVMDDTDALVYPNGGFDSTYPNDAGQSVIAIEAFRSVIERFAQIGKA